LTNLSSGRLIFLRNSSFFRARRLSRLTIAKEGRQKVTQTAFPDHVGHSVPTSVAMPSGRRPPSASECTAEQRSAATQRLAALGELTGGIAHDFRNLLAAIRSGLRLAERNSGDSVKVRAYLAESRVAIDRGIELTSQLLAFAQHQELDPHTGNVNEFLHTFEPFLRYGAGPDIRVVLELAPDLPDCLVDPAFFDAAVLNLVTNARDAMPAGGRVEISTDRVVEVTGPDPCSSGIYVRVRVKDHGRGMPPETLQRVFDPFFTTKGDKGTGIGLPQVRAFTEMVGGQIRIETKPDAGTTVDILFPADSKS
jgi:signal transduction histidine kinase